MAAPWGSRATSRSITPVLDAAGCYRRRDEAIRRSFPEYGPGYRGEDRSARPVGGESAYPRVLGGGAESPTGRQMTARATPDGLPRQIVAATSFKQRVRKMLEYYHADRLRYAVAGTPNRLEYDQGFFVKNGDGAADLKPIAHLYKTQVYQLAEFLGIPEEISRRPPTTDTYSLAQSQEEFFFSLPYDKMDLCLTPRTTGCRPRTSAAAVRADARGRSERVYRDIDAKRRARRTCTHRRYWSSRSRRYLTS